MLDYELLDQYHSETSHLKIIHVGAGAAGLLAAYKAKRMLSNYELICYEKNTTYGGTWYENRYPGCACDIPAHTYTYSFEPNAEWSGFYSYSDEIEQYFIKFHDKYNLSPYIKLNTRVVSATWDEEKSQYLVELEKTEKGKVEKTADWCHVLINGSGVVNKWKWPAIEGRETYKGDMQHSAQWDQKTTWEGKRVAVIGTGSSSIQMVPHLAKGAKSLTVFARNCTWIAPQVASDDQKIDPNGQAPAPAGKHHYIASEKEKFRTDAAFHLAYRKKLEHSVSARFPMFFRGSQYNKLATTGMTESMLQKIGPGNEELKEKFIPKWSPGCRRLTPGEGYLETLVLPHVNVNYNDITRFTATGIATKAGEELEFDLIACGTGFYIAYVPHFTIVGRGGVNMQEAWKETPNIYCSITAPGFPNYFVVNGPRGNWGQGCALPSHEVQMEYILQACKKIQEEGIASVEVKQEPTTQLNQHIDRWHTEKSVWAEDCKSWYKDNKPNGRVYIWSGSMLHHLKTLRSPKWEHYDIKYKNRNMWAYLGNGLIDLEMMAAAGKEVDLAPYIRSSDAQWSLEVPKKEDKVVVPVVYQ